MITIIYSKQYLSRRKKFIKNNIKRFKNTARVLRIFQNQPTHPSLHLEKLKGTKIWSIRIDHANRIIFVWLSETTALFVDIGPHSMYRNY